MAKGFMKRINEGYEEIIAGQETVEEPVAEPCEYDCEYTDLEDELFTALEALRDRMRWFGQKPGVDDVKAALVDVLFNYLCKGNCEEAPATEAIVFDVLNDDIQILIFNDAEDEELVDAIVKRYHEVTNKER